MNQKQFSKRPIKQTALIVASICLLSCSFVSQLGITSNTAFASSLAFANTAFQNQWQYSDKAVSEIPGLGRGYTWGPNSFGIKQESYVEGNGGKRLVQYFDKSRMELGNNNSSVTNGLLTKELVTGLRQDGDNTFTQLTPSTVQVVGDDNSSGGNAVAPTYASFKNVVSLSPGQNKAAQTSSVQLTIDHNGNVVPLPIGTGTATIPTTIAYYEPVLGHNVPKAFADYMQLQGQVWNGTSFTWGQVYTDNPTANVFGYPISEPYWTQAVVAGQTRDVMVQLFERRVLTYTPANPDAYKVEMGNIGQHYYQWRYNAPYSLAWTLSNQDSNATIQKLEGLAVNNKTNTVYVSDGDSIAKFDSAGNLLTRWGSNGQADGQFKTPAALTTDSAGNLYVFDSGNNRIEKFDSQGNFLLKWGSAGSGAGQFTTNPNSLQAVNLGSDAQDNIYVFDTVRDPANPIGNTHGRVQIFDTTGHLLNTWYVQDNDSYNNSGDMLVTAQGQVYITMGNRHGSSIEVYDSKGSPSQSITFSPLPTINFEGSELQAVDTQHKLYIFSDFTNPVYGPITFVIKEGQLLTLQPVSCCVRNMAIGRDGSIYGITTTYDSITPTITTLFKLAAKQ
jgi:hypothetical protein